MKKIAKRLRLPLAFTAMTIIAGCGDETPTPTPEDGGPSIADAQTSDATVGDASVPDARVIIDA